MGQVQPSSGAPAAGLGGAVATLVVFALERLGVSVPPEVAAAVATLAAAVAARVNNAPPGSTRCG